MPSVPKTEKPAPKQANSDQEERQSEGSGGREGSVWETCDSEESGCLTFDSSEKQPMHSPANSDSESKPAPKVKSSEGSNSDVREASAKEDADSEEDGEYRGFETSSDHEELQKVSGSEGSDAVEDEED